jgi:hypothetical protein
LVENNRIKARKAIIGRILISKTYSRKVARGAKIQ